MRRNRGGLRLVSMPETVAEEIAETPSAPVHEAAVSAEEFVNLVKSEAAEIAKNALSRAEASGAALAEALRKAGATIADVVREGEAEKKEEILKAVAEAPEEAPQEPAQVGPQLAEALRQEQEAALERQRQVLIAQVTWALTASLTALLSVQK